MHFSCISFPVFVDGKVNTDISNASNIGIGVISNTGNTPISGIICNSMGSKLKTGTG